MTGHAMFLFLSCKSYTIRGIQEEMDVDESPKQLEESVDLETGDDAVVLGDEDLSGFNQDNILPQPQEDVAKSRSWLQPTDYDSKDSEFEKHRTSRADGTCQWLLNSGTYKLWESVNNDRLLWVSGEYLL